MKRRMECLLVILVSPGLPKYSLSKLNIKQIRRVCSYACRVCVVLGELTHTQELMCSLIFSSWLWHPNCIVCLAQTCQAWLSAQQDWCLVRSYVSAAVFRRAIKIKVTAIAPLHETWVHQLFWTWWYKDGPLCNGSHAFVQVLHILVILFMNTLIFQSPSAVIRIKKKICLQHKNKINVFFPKVTLHQNVSKTLCCLKKNNKGASEALYLEQHQIY